jgi:hypothetical protein
MTVDEAYRTINYIIRKNQNGTITPDNFNLIMNRAQFSYMDYLIGEFPKYLPGRPMAAVEFGQNQDIRQRLTPFIKTPATLTINPVTGIAPYPADYEAADAMYYGIYDRRVKFIQQDRKDSHLNSYIDPIASNPVYLLIDEGLQFYPANLGTAKFSYIRTPPQIFWNSTTDSYGRKIYNPVGSTDPAWQDVDAMQIIVRALAMIGVNLQLGAVQQYSQMIKTQGD